MPNRNVTLVTGAGGFIGGWLAETLFLQGQKVRAGIHNWVGAVRPARFPMEIVLCDMMDMQQLDRAMDGVECVIHCARGADHEIAQGARNLLETATRHGVERFVFVSTTEVFGEQTGNIDETFSCQGMNDPYGDGKIKAEATCWDYHRKGMPVVIIRPPIVYGPFGNVFTVNIATKLMSGNWGVFKEVADGFSNLVYVTDLVSGILRASQNEAAFGEVFILNGPELITWNQYFQMFNDALGLSELKVYEQPGAMQLMTSIMEPFRNLLKYASHQFERPIRLVATKNRSAKRFMKFVENKMKTTPRLHDLHLFNKKAIYLSDKAQKMLWYKPEVTLKDGLNLSVQWLEQVGLKDALVASSNGH